MGRGKMRVCWVITKQHMKQFFSSPLAGLFFLVPIIVTLLFAGVFKAQLYPKSYRVNIIDKKQCRDRELFLKHLEGIELSFEPEQRALQRLEEGQLDAICFIETTNLRETIARREKGMTLKFKNQNDFTRDISSRIDEALEQLSGSSKGKEEARSEGVGHQKGLKIQAYAMFVMIFLFTCSKTLLVILEEKESGVYDKIMTTRLKKSQYIMGHLGGALIILLAQIIAEALLMKGLKLSFSISFMAFIGIGIVLSIVGLGISFFILVFTSHTETYQLVSATCITTLSMISGCIFPNQVLSESLNQISIISPIYWIMVVYKGVVNGEGLLKIIWSAAIAIGMSSVLILIAVVWEKEKGGQPFGIKEK